MYPWLLQELIPMQWEWHRLLRPHVFAPGPNLETPQEDARQEEDSQPRVPREVRWHDSSHDHRCYGKSILLQNLCHNAWGCLCNLYLPPVLCNRFEFDVPLEEVQTRRLDVAVKNNKMFYTRERKDIGMVGNASFLCIFSNNSHVVFLNALQFSLVSSCQLIIDSSFVHR